MNRLAICVLTVSAFSTSGVISAYEVDTHALMSYHSFQRSVLVNNDFGSRWGTDRFDNLKPFHLPDTAPYTERRDDYFDLSPDRWALELFDTRRRFKAYERLQFPALEDFRGSGGSDDPERPNDDPTSRAQELRMLAWLMRGTVREDDVLQKDYRPLEIKPDLDPRGEIRRVFHHFYDPIHGSGALSPPGLGTSACALIAGGLSAGCQPSTDWALGVSGVAITPTGSADPNRRNHFSWADGREALWCALTHRSNLLTPALDAGNRRLCWATAVASLGHVLHLLQDTAQPQHVRNDEHNPPELPWNSVFDPLTNFLFTTREPRRTYELWTNFRAASEISGPLGEDAAWRTLFASAATPQPPIVTGNYPKPMFSLPVKYFTTKFDEPGTPAARRGLADFTNRNFYSEGTQFSSDYPSPPADRTATAPGMSVVNSIYGQVDGFGTLTERVVLWNKVDTAEPTATDPPLNPFAGRIPLTTQSIWLPTPGALPPPYPLPAASTISLDQYTTQADVLIPRAISYGAGLIDYFFRGQLAVDSVAVPQGVVGVVDQGVTHSVDAQGYPRGNDGLIFGFKKLRLQLRNSTAPITEAGTAIVFPQAVGVGQLVAVARYHRNTCY